MNTFAVVKTSFRGVHRYEEAERDYIENNHHHNFFVKVKVTQTHNDREIEYFDLVDTVEDFIEDLVGPERVKNLGQRSCEMIAEDLLCKLKNLFCLRKISVEVMEDGFYGAEVNNYEKS